jgi:drug/metabolite transporter (DMT)-like permease
MWLGVLGVAIFAVTLPMTRLATGTVEAPQMSAWFITFGRAVLAGALSIAFLLITRSPRPTPAQRKPIFMAMLGNAIFFPLLLGFALRHVTSGHAAVFTALLPLATAAMSAWVLHQRARLGFWVCAGLGAVLVMAFSLMRAYQNGQGFGLEWLTCCCSVRSLRQPLATSMARKLHRSSVPSASSVGFASWHCP